MNAPHFDSLVRHLAARRLSRRTALAAGASGFVLPHWPGRLVAAQDTPAATPATTVAIDVLFAQSFDGGSFAPTPGASSTYTLTLHGVPQDTVWFANRPERAAGVVPTAKFVTGRAFSPTNPPNAAIVAHTSLAQDTLVVELRDPQYDAGARTVTYTARVIDNYQGEGLAFLANQQNDHKIDVQLKEGSLFVDQLSCSPDGSYCKNNSDCCSGSCCQDIEHCPPGICL